MLCVYRRLSQLKFCLDTCPVRYLALHLALLFEAEVLWSVSHAGEVCLRVVSVKQVYKNRKKSI